MTSNLPASSGTTTGVPFRVVSNTTPLITLGGIGLLSLMPQLYQRIIVPEQVVIEYRAGRQLGDPDLGHAVWLDVVRGVSIDPAFAPLDPGEAASLSLAVNIGADLIVLDEARARRFAERAGLHIVGSLGIVLRAKQQGILGQVRPIIERMQQQGRRFHPQLIQQVLDAAGE